MQGFGSVRRVRIEGSHCWSVFVLWVWFSEKSEN